MNRITSALSGLLCLAVMACSSSAPAPAPAPAAKGAEPAKPAAAATPAAPAAQPVATTAGAPVATKPAAPTAAAAPAKPAAGGVPEWVTDPQVYEAAKKEGTVSFFCSLPQSLCEAIGKRFTEHTQIKVEVTRLSSGPQWDRIQREAQAGIKNVDVTENGLPAGFIDAKAKGQLTPYTPKGGQKIDQAYRDKDGAFGAFYVNVQFIAYNPRIIQAADAPKSWKDVLDPKWKGKLSIGHPQYSGIAVDWNLVMSKLTGGWDFLQKLKALDPFIVRSLVEAIPPLVSGERPLNAESYSDSAWEAKLKNQPIEIVFPEEGIIASNDYTGILKDAPHPNAAKVLVDFLYSAENAQALIDQYIYVTHPDAKPPAGFKPIKELKTIVVDPAEVSPQVKNIRDRFADVFG
ncbi:MAG: extracellular solute-binding protein [Chloroflexi bacterium]|nr:extracellular solute-binding protein [Chloroflexota bacterium]